MLQRIRNRKAQSTLEYAILIVIIIAALLTLQTYIKRGIGGRLKQATDDIGDQYSQAEDANYYKKVTTVSNTTETFESGVSETQLRAPKTSNTEQRIELNAFGEYWGTEPAAN